MLRAAVKTDLGIVRIYDSGRMLFKPNGKVKWHKLVPKEALFRGVGYKRTQQYLLKRHLRAVK